MHGGRRGPRLTPPAKRRSAAHQRTPPSTPVRTLPKAAASEPEPSSKADSTWLPLAGKELPPCLPTSHPGLLFLFQTTRKGDTKFSCGPAWVSTSVGSSRQHPERISVCTQLLGRGALFAPVAGKSHWRQASSGSTAPQQQSLVSPRGQHARRHLAASLLGAAELREAAPSAHPHPANPPARPGGLAGQQARAGGQREGRGCPANKCPLRGGRHEMEPGSQGSRSGQGTGGDTAGRAAAACPPHTHPSSRCSAPSPRVPLGGGLPAAGPGTHLGSARLGGCGRPAPAAAAPAPAPAAPLRALTPRRALLYLRRRGAERGWAGPGCRGRGGAARIARPPPASAPPRRGVGPRSPLLPAARRRRRGGRRRRRRRAGSPRVTSLGCPAVWRPPGLWLCSPCRAAGEAQRLPFVRGTAGKRHRQHQAGSAQPPAAHQGHTPAGHQLRGLPREANTTAGQESLGRCRPRQGEGHVPPVTCPQRGKGSRSWAGKPPVQIQWQGEKSV